MRGAACELHAAFSGAAHSSSSEELMEALAEVAAVEAGPLALLGEAPPSAPRPRLAICSEE